MRHFHFAGRQPQGTPIEGWLMAKDRDDALHQLRSRDIAPYTVRPGPGHIPLRVPPMDLLFCLRELAGMRRSGMAIDDAIDAVGNSTENRLLKQAFGQVYQMVRSGFSLSEAFGAVPGAFPNYSVPLLRLGEANGNLASAISIIADRLDEETRLRGEVKSAMTYPAFLLATSVSVVLFLLVAIVPRFGSMVSAGDGEASSLGLLLIVSEFLREYLWVWGGALVALIVAAVVGWRTGRMQAALWRVIRKAPGVSDIIESWEVVQFSGCMSNLLGGGVGLLDSLTLAAETLGNDEKKVLLKRASDDVRRGETLGAALESHRMFPGLVIQMIRVGEKSADLPISMEEIANLYKRRMSENIARVLSLLEPAVIVLMGLVVGTIMISLLSAIVSINEIAL